VKHDARTVLSMLFVMTVLTGVAYPLAITGLAQLLFPWQANGSLIEIDGAVIGSALIGQPFDDPGYFWSRPSATTDHPYDALASSGSNLGPTSTALRSEIAARGDALRQWPVPEGQFPADLVTASASGLDPHISPAAAMYQVPRVAESRGMSEPDVEALVRAHIEPRTLGVLGEPVVNVLRLNVALDSVDAR
jgi:potassium-transporting ATPase KdpC subunit